MTPATVYAMITTAVNDLVRRARPADRERAAYMVMRAAALALIVVVGSRRTAEKVYRLADDLATGRAA